MFLFTKIDLPRGTTIYVSNINIIRVQMFVHLFEHEILREQEKRISNFEEDIKFLSSIFASYLHHYNSSSNRKRRIGSSEIKIQGETNTRGKEVHFLRVNATKYIYIFIHGEGRSCLYIA